MRLATIEVGFDLSRGQYYVDVEDPEYGTARYWRVELGHWRTPTGQDPHASVGLVADAIIKRNIGPQN